MTCQEFQAALNPYVDGELGIDETLAADAHSAECPRCRRLAEGERQFRRLLRCQPGEAAPAELRARIVARVRRSARVAALRPWLLVPLAVAAVLVAVFVPPGARQSAPLVGELVDKHIAYAQIERPAEFASEDQREVEAWFRERADLRVTVPDYSPAGIRLVGARLAVTRERRAAYVLYEKGHTLLSVFMVPASGGETELAGRRVAYGGHDYLTREWKGYRTVSWTDGRAIFGLVSMLDYEALLECADRLRAERARRTPL
jgi:mycothiol system anti-sigma-R factor